MQSLIGYQERISCFFFQLLIGQNVSWHLGLHYLYQMNNNNSSQMKDAFNWPFPQRSDLMSFSKIQPSEFTNKPKLRSISQDYSYKFHLFLSVFLENDQIVRKPNYFNKPAFANRSDDIDGAAPQILRCNKTFNRPIVEIEGICTKPKMSKFTTGRITNPLEPQYVLPTANMVQAEQNIKFLRDTLNIRDIDGTKAKKDPWYNKIRNIDPYTEIEGTHPRQRRVFKDFVNKLDTSDISGGPRPIMPRDMNPLEPIYNWTSNEGKGNYGKINGSQPKVKHPDLNKDKSFSLETKSIQGAQAGTVQYKFMIPDVIYKKTNTQKNFKKRSQYRAINQIDDIQGAQVGTLIKGIRTKRNCNPLQPSYNFPGYNE